MIKAELIYNPYLLETDVRFNGQPPRINSLVEKYQDGRLQDWIKELPEIFHDEMNGYDFELEFSGTSRDFCELQRAFKQAGVSESEVHLFHKNELEERDVKRQRIRELLDWLENTPNRNYDNAQFRKDNEILFDGAYSLISVQKEGTEQHKIDWAPVSVEVINSVPELDNTDLSFTPIIINIDPDMISELQKIIRYLRKRNDVVVQQVFFNLDESLNRDTVYRIIKDLGIKRPHFINGFDDDKLKKYFELYPLTEYIIDSITMLRIKANDVEAILGTEKTQGEQSNTEIDEQIHGLDSEIDKARLADEEITARNNIDKPAAFSSASNILANTISNWRKRKTKTVETEEARALANELYMAAFNAFKDFCSLIDDSVFEMKTSIDQVYKTAYEIACCEDNFTPIQIGFDLEPLDIMPNFETDLMSIYNEEKAVRTGIGLFAINNPEDEQYTQTAYYMQPWREHVFSLVEPISEKYMNTCMDLLRDYNSRVVEAYHEHLQHIIADKYSEKEQLSKQLSSEAKQIQLDSTWLNEFKRQLKAIERG